MDERYCQELRKRIDEKIGNTIEDTKENSRRILALERFQEGTIVEMRNLTAQIADLVSIIKWFGIFAFSTMAGFFIWYVQRLGM